MAKERKTARPRFWIILMMVFLLGSSVVYGSKTYYMRLQDKALAELTQTRDELLTRNAELEWELAFSQTDEYIRRQARNTLGMLMEDEIRFTNSGE